jgi:DNA invertase Pin-like site-specific DNA recombinase
MRKIHKIEAASLKLPTRKRVAAYARISVERGRTLGSLSAQVSYYSDYIQKQPGWEYVGVYADSGETGTSAGRDEFQRLLADCEAGKIDIVLTKSISRFARNTVILLDTVRKLNEIGVEVRFEREGISSASAEGELMLSILASFAQEEAYNLSENTKWALRKGFEKGRQSPSPIYGYRWDGENYS